MSRRPYTMHSYSKMKVPDKEEVKNVGIYTTKEARKEVAQEIKRTHFQLGSDLNSFPHSLNQDTYQNMQVDDRNLGDQQKRMAKINKRSNFIFGNDPSGKGETTSNQTYNSKQFSHLSGNANTFSANTLRKGNFRLGFNNENTYETTSNANFNDKNPEFTRSHVNVNRGDKNTIPLGNGKTSYQTTNNLNFTQKDVAESFKDKLLMRQRGEKLKKANFSFGHFNNRNSLKNEPHNITDHANKFHSEMVKQKQQAKQRGVELKKSNFQLAKDPKYGSDSNAFKSMAQFQFNEEKITGDNMAQENKKNSEISKNLQTNLRSSHFEFGNNKGNQGSCSHDAHQKFNIDQKGLDDSNKLAKKMQSSNFELGSNKYKGLPLQSTYKDSANLNVDYGKVKADSSNIDSKKTTIDIGKGK